MEQSDDHRISVAPDGPPDGLPPAGTQSAREAAALLGISERTVRRAIRNGRLAATKRGRSFWVSAAELGRYRASIGRPGDGRSSGPPNLILLPSAQTAGAGVGTGDRLSRFGQSTTIPRPLTSLIGRQSEVAHLRDLLRDENCRLITITGPGGIGKTRLAIAATSASAPEFTDGAVFVPLAPVGDPAFVISAIARALDVRESSARPLLETVAVSLQSQRLLLVLDNFEHVVGAATDLVYLLDACPHLTVLVTSREPLRVDGEQRFQTSALTVPKTGPPYAIEDLAAFSAIDLFVARARSENPGFSLDAQNAASIVEICRRLDGLPLAIELAAAWVRVVPPGTLLERLEPRLALLQGGGEERPLRLRTMHDAIAWSYDLLSADEARLFRRLAVFVGGFSLAAAEWVADGRRRDAEGERGETKGMAGRPAPYQLPGAQLSTPGFVLGQIASLVDKSLLQPSGDSHREARFSMLETVREFALARLGESGELESIAAAHAAFMMNLAERAEPHLLGPDERIWRSRLDADLANLRAALIWSLDHDGEVALRLAAALWVYWTWESSFEGRRWLQAALARPVATTARVQARARTTHGALAVLAGDLTEGSASCIAAIALARESGDVVTEALARWLLASCHLYAGAPAAAAPELDRALALFEKATTSKDMAQAAYARWSRGLCDLSQGDAKQGFTFLEEALAQVRAVGTDGSTILFLGDLAGWSIDLGDVSRARPLLVEALQLAANYDDTFLVVSPLPCLALSDALDGLPTNAARILGAVEAWWPQRGMAMPSHLQHRIDRARTLATDALGRERFGTEYDRGRLAPEAFIAEAIARATAGSAAGNDGNGPRDLTRRERDVLGLLVDGYADKEIAAALEISRATASRHVASIRAKLNASSRGAAVAIAVRAGLA